MEVIRARFTLNNIDRAPCDKPGAPQDTALKRQATHGPFLHGGNILVTYPLKMGVQKSVHHVIHYSNTVSLPQCSDWQPQPSQLMFSSLTFSWSLCLLYHLCLFIEQYLDNYTDAETQRQAREQDTVIQPWRHCYHRLLLALLRTDSLLGEPSSPLTGASLHCSTNQMKPSECWLSAQLQGDARNTASILTNV